jgi:hypothetical protein
MINDFIYAINVEKESEISKQHGKLESRVDTEVANLKALFERYKVDSIKYMAGKSIGLKEHNFFILTRFRKLRLVVKETLC